MSKKSDALQRLTAARRKLAQVQGSKKNPEPWVANQEYLDANREVIEAEADVRLGSLRGWNYEADE